MLPLDTFLFDNVADAREHEEDNHFRLPYVPLLGCHMHPHNYFMIQIDTNTRYIGEYITMLPISRIPEWQLRQPPRDTFAECPHTGATSDFRALFKVYIIENEMPPHTKSILIPVPYHNYHKCIGLHQAVRTNAYIWLMVNQICDLAFLTHAETIQHGYSQFGGKGISNYYYIYSQIEYEIDIESNSEIKANCRLMHYSHHKEFNPAGVSYNSRIYSSLGAFRDTFNKLMHTKRMFQANGYRINQYLSSECFKYIVYKCKGKCVLEDKKVDRVRRIFLSDLAQEKRKFLNQIISIIRIETAEQLQHFRSILGSTFGTGA